MKRQTLNALALLISAWLVSACRPEVIRTSLEDRAISSAVQAWYLTGHRELVNCTERRISVKHARDAAEFSKWCWGAAPEDAASCLNHVWHLIVLRPGQELEPDGEPVIHEMIHLFLLCESNHYGKGNEIDPDHLRPDAWKANAKVFGPNSVQSVAERLYRGEPPLL